MNRPPVATGMRALEDKDSEQSPKYRLSSARDQELAMEGLEGEYYGQRKA